MLSTIVKAFKTRRHYLQGCKHKVLVLTGHNNLRGFMYGCDEAGFQTSRARPIVLQTIFPDFLDKAAKLKTFFGPQIYRSPIVYNPRQPRRLWAENPQIFYRRQSSLTKASLSGQGPLSLSCWWAATFRRVLDLSPSAGRSWVRYCRAQVFRVSAY